MSQSILQKEERRREKLIVVLAFALVISVMNSTMFNIAIPTIIDEFRLQPSQAGWIVTGYIIILYLLCYPPNIKHDFWFHPTIPPFPIITRLIHKDTYKLTIVILNPFFAAKSKHQTNAVKEYLFNASKRKHNYPFAPQYALRE